MEERYVFISRLRIGHTALNYSLHEIGKHGSGKCDTCGELETVKHVLFEFSAPFKMSMKIRTRQTHASLVLEYNTDCKNSKYNTLKEDQQQAPNEPFTTLCVIWSRAALMLLSRAFTLTSYSKTSIKSNDSRSAVPIWLKWFALRGPDLTQMIRALRSRSDSNDLRPAVPIWLKWFAPRGPDLTQMIRAPRSRSDSNDSRSAVPNWLKWFALRGPELTQMIRDSCSAVPNWLKWFTLRGPELTQMIRGPELTQMIRAPRVPNWLKWFALRGPELTQMIRAPRSRTDSNDSRSASPELTQMIRSRTDSNDSRSAVPNWLKWFALRGPELTQMIRAPRSRTDSNDSRSAVPNWLKWFGPELTQMIPEH